MATLAHKLKRMKEVIFMRHGKSSWEYNVGDQDRPLNPRGIGDAHLVGSEFASLGIPLDAIYSSPANRALHTCMIAVKEMGQALGNVRIEDQLYDFSGEKVLSFLKGLNNKTTTVMVFGHNHAFTHLANTLGSKKLDNVPTSGLVHLRFEVTHWGDLRKGETKNIIFPKQLKSL